MQKVDFKKKEPTRKGTDCSSSANCKDCEASPFALFLRDGYDPLIHVREAMKENVMPIA
jgi:hypothetical protein